METKPLKTSFETGVKDHRFSDISESISVPEHLEKLPRQRFSPTNEAKLLFRVLKASKKAKSLLLFSSRGYLRPELLAIILLSFLSEKKRPSIILYGEMFQPNAGLRGSIERLVMKLVDRGVSLYSFYSTKELELFPQLWGAERNKMRFCPFFLDEERMGNIPPATPDASREDFIFAGGNSHRDYPPLIEAARAMPEKRFYIATARPVGTNDIPDNVQVGWPDLETYLSLMRSASLVVIPMNQDLSRTVGLQTLLEALALGQAVIATDALGISDYIEHGRTGYIVDGSTQSYVTTINAALDPKNAITLKNIRGNAIRAAYDDFSFESHIAHLLEIVQEAFSIKDSWNQR